MKSGYKKNRFVRPTAAKEVVDHEIYCYVGRNLAFSPKRLQEVCRAFKKPLGHIPEDKSIYVEEYDGFGTYKNEESETVGKIPFPYSGRMK